MSDRFDRTKALISEKGFAKLKESTVCVFGIGGVGSYTVEALARSGVGNLIIIDNANIDVTNINRQIIALESTVNMPKVDVMKKRCLEINPEINMQTYQIFANDENIFDLIPKKISYIADAVDSVNTKLALIQYAKTQQIPIISCMGTGNKLHPELFTITDIFKTEYDPLAKIMRNELKKCDIKSLNVVFSPERPVIKGDDMPLNNNGKRVPASISYVPSVAGLLMASFIVNEIIQNN